MASSRVEILSKGEDGVLVTVSVAPHTVACEHSGGLEVAGVRVSFRLTFWLASSCL